MCEQSSLDLWYENTPSWCSVGAQCAKMCTYCLLEIFHQEIEWADHGQQIYGKLDSDFHEVLWTEWKAGEYFWTSSYSIWTKRSI